MDDSINNKVSELKKKVFALWEAEGKWEADNPNSPLYGLDKDPLVSLLITAMVYQQRQMEKEVENFRTNMVSEFENAVLPFHLTQASPAIAMMCTAKAQDNGNEYHVGQDADFKVQKEAFQLRESIHFCPLFESNIAGATVNSVVALSDNSYKLTLTVTDEKVSLGGVGFFFKGLEFGNMTMSLGDKPIPMICPWEYDRFPMNPDFSFWNALYSKSLVFGTNEQWFELWASQNINYYMVDPQASVALKQGDAELTLHFDGLKNKSVVAENIVINSFPVVNVIKKTLRLTPYEPVVRITNDDDFFMNLVGESDTLDEADKFIIRRYGCERFGFDELLRLADELRKRNNTDFYAYQLIPSLQNDERMTKLKVLLKDILTIVRKEGAVKTGVYALLKENAKVDLSVPLKALYTKGEKGNGVKACSVVLSAPSELDLGQTSVLTESLCGRNEVTDTNEKKLLSHYYALTNDKIVTRTDLKMFCIKELHKYGINNINRVEVTSDGDASRTVKVYVSRLNPEIMLDAILRRIEKTVDVYSSGLMPVKIEVEAV